MALGKEIDVGGNKFMISGWIIAAGIIIASIALLHFWEDIAMWLNNVAADAVQRKFGVCARKTMQRAVCKVTRVVDKINNLARIFLKEERVGVLRQIDIKATVPVYEVDEDVLKELNRKKELINDFTYNG